MTLRAYQKTNLLGKLSGLKTTIRNQWTFIPRAQKADQNVQSIFSAVQNLKNTCQILLGKYGVADRSCPLEKKEGQEITEDWEKSYNWLPCAHLLLPNNTSIISLTTCAGCTEWPHVTCHHINFYFFDALPSMYYSQSANSKYKMVTAFNDHDLAK